MLTASKIEMGNIGLLVDSFQIQSIDDGNLGYIAALAAPHNAAVQRDAQIAQARARQAAAEAEQASTREQAKYQRETEILQAQYKKDIDSANAEAAQAAPLAQARAQQEVMEEQRRLAAKRADLREQELQAEVVKPAEAEAEKVRILAEADADRTKIAAEAPASNNKIALDQQIIEQLPLLVSEADKGLAGARLTVLNGPERINEMITGVVAQGLSILGTLRDNLGSATNAAEDTPDEPKSLPTNSAPTRLT